MLITVYVRRNFFEASSYRNKECGLSVFPMRNSDDNKQGMHLIRLVTRFLKKDDGSSGCLQ